MPYASWTGCIGRLACPIHEVLCAIRFFESLEPHTKCTEMTNTLLFEQYVLAFGGRITCPRCQAKSKRSQLQCGAPSLNGRRVCKAHGGLSTGARSETGRQRCADAKTTHGFETRQMRTERALGMRRLRELEDLGHLLGVMRGPRMPGRKPVR